MELTESFLECCFNIVNTNLVLYEDFFEMVIKDFMMQGKVEFGVKTVNSVIITY